ncbi:MULTISPECIES: ABC transporter permease [Spongiibacter]|uniref:ABC transporter permease n=1 Tax=Spongiibacter TaxID=630749 RepID=UPI000C3E8E1A|nr:MULTISPECIES: ABC transporter permease [Spongiibacter]MBO6754621.1 ABC transporter permease [Spongiibacter sp.]MBU73818.1 peptide ABC transporter permease [Spongiibacter sp.]|tara:strand:- start:1564 stop:2442 length:879 start_codon:yes stop_codon:yes gene_type:complete
MAISAKPVVNPGPIRKLCGGVGNLFVHPVGRWASTVLVVFALVAVLAPLIAPYDPFAVNTEDSMQSPSLEHLMGTDLLGRDIFSRVVFGAQVSMLIGVVALLISVSIGVAIGLFAGYYGGRIDEVAMRLIDTLMAFPGILLALTVVALLGPGIENVMIAVGIGGIANFARVVRGSVLSIKEDIYVDAARSTGASDLRVIFLHILPNAMPPVLTLASMSYGWALLSAAGLSFLGLGATPPTPEWGAMLGEGRDLMWDAPWTVVFPGVAILCVVLASNLLGDALRDILDPRLKS